MRSIRSALAAAFLVLMLVVPAASADSVTVNGSGDIDKMSVNNGKKALTVKLYGFDPPCEAHYFKVVVFWGGKPAYQASGGCYPGAQWITSLEYFSNRNAQDSKPVRCPKFGLAYKAAGKHYKLTIPRTCMKKAPDRVKVRSEGDNYRSTTGGEAGPTKALGRG